MTPAFGDTIEELLQEAEARLGKLPDITGHVVYGLAGEELAAFGDQVDFLVVGSRSYGPVRRLVVGSTSDYLERHARCSLLVLSRVEAHRPDGASTSGESAGRRSGRRIGLQRRLASPRPSAWPSREVR